MEIRYAKEADVKTILDLIIELAEYEKLANEVVATEEILKEWLFEKKKAEVLIGEYEGKAVGYCLFFYNFSTFLGKAGIYIEDIYVKPEVRGKGFGKKFFAFMAQLAEYEGCGRIDWSCLKWNQPSIDFYKSMSAVPQEEWVGFRLNEDAIKKIAKHKED